MLSRPLARPLSTTPIAICPQQKLKQPTTTPRSAFLACPRLSQQNTDQTGCTYTQRNARELWVLPLPRVPKPRAPLHVNTPRGPRQIRHLLLLLLRQGHLDLRCRLSIQMEDHRCTRKCRLRLRRLKVRVIRLYISPRPPCAIHLLYKGNWICVALDISCPSPPLPNQSNGLKKLTLLLSPTQLSSKMAATPPLLRASTP